MTRDVNLYSNLFHLHRAKGGDGRCAIARAKAYQKISRPCYGGPPYQNDLRHRTDTVYCHENEHDRSHVAWHRTATNFTRPTAFIENERNCVSIEKESSLRLFIRRWNEHRHFYEGNSTDCPIEQSWNFRNIFSFFDRISIVRNFLSRKKKKNHPWLLKRIKNMRTTIQTELDYFYHYPVSYYFWTTFYLWLMDWCSRNDIS